MRKFIAVLSSTFVLVALFGTRSAPAAERQGLACRGNGAGCDGSGDCCSKNCCAINNHNKCVSASAAQHLSCR